MTLAQTKFIYELASILQKPKKDYFKRIIEFNSLSEEKGSASIYKPIALVDVEATAVHSEEILKGADILFNIEKFKKSKLCDAIDWTFKNVSYNPITIFQLGRWTMIGVVVTEGWFSPNGDIYYSGIYLREDEDHFYGFFKLEEFFKK